MAELKTKESKVTVAAFLKTLDDAAKQKEAQTLVKLIEKVTGEKATLWGTNIIGCGKVKLTYASGRELDWFHLGLSPRKQHHVVYGIPNSANKETLLKKLGKYKTGKGCLYIKRLEDIDLKILEELLGLYKHN